MLRPTCFVFTALLACTAYSGTYEGLDKQRRTCEKMGEVAAVGYNYKKEHGMLDAILYVSEKKVALKKKKPAEIAEDEAQVYEAFLKGLDHDLRSVNDAYMAGWSWCMDGMKMR